jgi:hypothetical protein
VLGSEPDVVVVAGHDDKVQSQKFWSWHVTHYRSQLPAKDWPVHFELG